MRMILRLPPPRNGGGRLPPRARAWLADRAVVRAPPTHHRAYDRRSACVAGLPVAPEDLHVHVLAPLVATTVDVILETRAPVRDAAFEHVPCRRMQPPERRQRHAVGGRIGTHTRLEQRLVDVDVPQPG